MHMADALLSPAVGGALWAASAAALRVERASRAQRRRRRQGAADGRAGRLPVRCADDQLRDSRHRVERAPRGRPPARDPAGAAAALLVIASVLVVQALFFADGGLLALGCNIFNLGFLPAFVAYPLVYRPLAPRVPARSGGCSPRSLAAVVGLQLGALGVVTQTVASGHRRAAAADLRRLHAADPSGHRHRRRPGHRGAHRICPASPA